MYALTLAAVTSPQAMGRMVGRSAVRSNNNRRAGPVNGLAPACRSLISAGWHCIVLCVSQRHYRPHWPILSLVSAVISVAHPASHCRTLLALEFSHVQSSHYIKLGCYSLLIIIKWWFVRR